MISYLISLPRAELMKFSDKNKSLADELEHAKRVILNQDEKGKRSYYNHENQKKNIEFELKKALDEIEELREKGVQYDDLKKQMRKLEVEKEILEEKVELL